MTGRRRPAWLPLAGALAGCLGDDTQPPPPTTVCSITADCPAADEGQICDLGICWGAPPEHARFGAVLVPPAERAQELAATEITELDIAPDGTISGLAFEQPVLVTGRVILDGAPDLSIEAQIRVARPSRIPGGAPYIRTVVAASGLPAGVPAFQLPLPPTREGEEYEVVITPTSVYGADASAAAPPLHFSWSVTESGPVEWALYGSDDLRELQGRVVDALGRGVEGMQVVAYGHWSDEEPFERISTVAITDHDGAYALQVADGVLEGIDLVARPLDMAAPTLRAFDLMMPSAAATPPRFPDLVMPTYPRPVPFELPISGPNPGGGTRKVKGADVRMHVVLAETDSFVATFDATAISDPEGIALFDLIPGGDGSRSYTVEVMPQAGDLYAATFGTEVEVGPPNPAQGPSVLPAVELGFRILVAGALLRADDAALDGAVVQAVPARVLREALAPADRGRLDALPLPSAVTDSHGGFALRLDPALLGAEAVYDLDFVPRGDSRAPRWSYRGLIPRRDTTTSGTLGIGEITLPPASFARGPVTDPDSLPVSADVQIFQLSDCAPEEKGCDSAADLRGVWTTGADGVVQVVLPDPPAP